jgi:thiamine-phosphate pyrophosphorylase
LRSPSPLPRLYVITDRHSVPGGDLAKAVGAALAGGARLIQLREKDLSVAELRPLVRALRELTRASHARLLLNLASDVERLALAREIGVDGVHLTSAGHRSIARVREVCGAGAILGVSTHRVDEVESAARAGADLVTFGPVFETPSKIGMGEPTGLEPLAAAVQAAGPTAVFALGGITLEAIATVMASGAHGIAVIRACLGAVDPDDASRSILERLAVHR